MLPEEKKKHYACILYNRCKCIHPSLCSRGTSQTKLKSSNLSAGFQPTQSSATARMSFCGAHMRLSTHDLNRDWGAEIKAGRC